MVYFKKCVYRVVCKIGNVWFWYGCRECSFWSVEVGIFIIFGRFL